MEHVGVTDEVRGSKGSMYVGRRALGTWVVMVELRTSTITTASLPPRRHKRGVAPSVETADGCDDFLVFRGLSLDFVNSKFRLSKITG